MSVSWTTALLLASILSATDPVSVVAALREFGAPARLSALIEGEALLNDGSAFVMFLVFLSFARGENPSLPSVASTFLNLSLGGAALGYCIAIPTSKSRPSS